MIQSCKFNITAYAFFVQVGCKLHKYQEWERYIKAGAFRDEFDSDDEYEKCKIAVQFAISWIKNNLESETKK